MRKKSGFLRETKNPLLTFSLHSSFRIEKRLRVVEYYNKALSPRESDYLLCVDPQHHHCYYPQEAQFPYGVSLVAQLFFSLPFFDRITRKAFLNLQRVRGERDTLFFVLFVVETKAGDWCSYIFLRDTQWLREVSKTFQSLKSNQFGKLFTAFLNSVLKLSKENLSLNQYLFILSW